MVGRRQASVVIVSVESGSAAEEAGFRPGDAILEVDNVRVRSARQFLRAVASSKSQFVIVRVDRYIPSIKEKV